jgi:FkbM family methyltransferase
MHGLQRIALPIVEMIPGLKRLIIPVAKLKWRRQQRALRGLRRVLAEDPVVAVEEFAGVFALDVRSHLFERIVLNGYYEPEIVARIEEHIPFGADVIDVGAAVGFYSVLLAQRLHSGRVLAIEPIPSSLNRLRRNLELNGVSDKVDIFAGAATDREGEIQMHSILGMEEYSSVGPIIHPAVPNKARSIVAAPSTTIDSLVTQHSLRPGLIKIDVEGMEHKVLLGARRTLRDFRPVIYSELSDTLLRHNGTSGQEVVNFLKDHGYVVQDPFLPGVPPGKRRFGDVICTPLPG